MRRLLFIIILLTCAIGLGYLIHQDPGYVLISYHHWTIESSLWFSVAAVLVAYFVLYFVWRLIKSTARIGYRLRRWRRMRQRRYAARETRQGLCDLLEGNYSKAENRLIRAAKLIKSPLINYLNAAKAAQGQNKFEQRDEYLRLASHGTRHSELAVGLTQAELQIQSKQWEMALATLKRLQNLYKNQRRVLQLLSEVYLALQDWSELEKLLPRLQKNKVLNVTDYTALEQHTYRELLLHSSNNNALALQQCWQNVPKQLQEKTELIKLYVDGLDKTGQAEFGAPVLERALKKHWDSLLLDSYAALNTNTEQQIHKAEQWHKKHSQDAELLLCLGRLYARAQLWGQAKQYLQQAIAMQASDTAYAALAQVHEALGETSEALRCYQLIYPKLLK